MLHKGVPNVATILSTRAQRSPDSIALVDTVGGKRWTYAQIHGAASTVAARLQDRFLQGDRVALCTENGPHFVIGWFGALYAGLTTLPMSTRSTSREIAFAIDHAQCRAVITDEVHKDRVEPALQQATQDVEGLLIETMLEPSSEKCPPIELEKKAIAMLLYTSGTTGAPKGAEITHESLIAHTDALLQDALRLGPNDRVLGVLPLAHSYGIRMTLLAPFAAGARTIFVAKFDARATLAMMNEHGVTWVAAVPTMLAMWAGVSPDQPPQSLRWCLSAGAPLSTDLLQRAEAKLGVEIRQGYGLTEASFSTINAPPDDRIPLSVGRPIKNISIRILDEAGNEQKAGQKGEVVVRGDNVMAGYLDDPTATTHVMRGGWLHTGDIGKFDDEGRLYIVDRIKDMIIVGGRNVYPAEVENVLGDYPGVEQAAVVGLPDTTYSETIVAVLLIRNGEVVDKKKLDMWLRRRLAAYKVPRQIAIATSLPKGASGKIVKRKLRDELQNRQLFAETLGS